MPKADQGTEDLHPQTVVFRNFFMVTFVVDIFAGLEVVDPVFSIPNKEVPPGIGTATSDLGPLF